MIYMEELGKLWNASDDARYKGEHPGCDRLQEADGYPFFEGYIGS